MLSDSVTEPEIAGADSTISAEVVVMVDLVD